MQRRRAGASATTRGEGLSPSTSAEDTTLRLEPPQKLSRSRQKKAHTDSSEIFMRIASGAATALALGLAVIGMNDDLSAETRAICVTIGLATACAIAMFLGTTRAEHTKTVNAQEEHFAALRNQVEAVAAFMRAEMRANTREQRENLYDVKLRLESLTGALMEETGELRLAKEASSRERLAIREQVAELAAAVRGQAVDSKSMARLEEQVEALTGAVREQMREEIEERLAAFAVDVFRTQDSGNVVPMGDARQRR